MRSVQLNSRWWLFPASGSQAPCRTTRSFSNLCNLYSAVWYRHFIVLLKCGMDQWSLVSLHFPSYFPCKWFLDISSVRLNRAFSMRISRSTCILFNWLNSILRELENIFCPSRLLTPMCDFMSTIFIRCCRVWYLARVAYKGFCTYICLINIR